MKKIELPQESIVIAAPNGEQRTHTAADLIEDVIMVRQAWRTSEGARHAALVFAALDKLLPAPLVGKSTLQLPDTTYNFLLEQAALDPATSISPRSANRLYLKLVHALNEAEEVVEMAAAKNGPRVDSRART